MKFKYEITQILVAAFLMSVLFMAFSWICIHYQNPAESAKESLDITVSFMGVLATIFAALIAVLLFNDWKEQHDKSVISEIAKQVLIYANRDIDHLLKIIRLLKDLNQELLVSQPEIKQKIENHMFNFIENGKATFESASVLFELTKNEPFQKLSSNYHTSQIDLAKNISMIIKDGRSTIFLLQYLESNKVGFAVFNMKYKSETIKFILNKVN